MVLLVCVMLFGYGVSLFAAIAFEQGEEIAYAQGANSTALDLYVGFKKEFQGAVLVITAIVVQACCAACPGLELTRHAHPAATG